MPADFDALYRAHFHEVQRWVRYFGAAEADVDDLTQRSFQILLERSADFRGDNPKGWLYGIVRRVVAGHRRYAWVRKVLLGHSAPGAELLAPSGPDEHTLACKRLVERTLARMSEKLRTTLLLHQVEGYTLEEIAALQGIGLNTAGSRLRLARRQFAVLSREEEGAP